MIREPHEEKRSNQSSKPSLPMRLMAGFWFGITFGILASGYLSYVASPDWSLAQAFHSTVGFYRIIAPAFIAGFCGALVGAAIVAGSDSHPALMSPLRGLAIGFVSIASYIALWSLEETLNSTRRELGQFLWGVVYATLFWGLIAVIPAIFTGALSGFLLYAMTRGLKRVT
jgi:hypothetical protein